VRARLQSAATAAKSAAKANRSPGTDG
jgi:hypothetical protein